MVRACVTQLIERDTMSTITIHLPDERLQELQSVAQKFQVTPEELVRVSIDALLNRPEEEFRRALVYVLRKNAELYKRLA